MSDAVRMPGKDRPSVWKRVAISTAGGTLLALGLRQRSWTGYAAALAGGWLVYRGIQGDGSREVELATVEELEASAEAIDVQRTLTVQAPREEVRAFLEEPTNLDAVLGTAGSVEAVGEDRQRWELATPLGGSLTWEMQRVEDEDVLGWASADEEELDVQLATRPAPGDRGTEVTLHVGFQPPGGAVGQLVLDRLDVIPHRIIARTLRRTKSLLETGELPTIEAPPPDPSVPPTPEH